MRLIDGGPDTVLLYPEVVEADDDGNPIRVASDTPITLAVQLHRGTAQDRPKDSTAFGQSDTENYYFNTSTELPAGAYAKAFALDRWWDVEGAPQPQGRSSRTAHTRVVLRSREPVI